MNILRKIFKDHFQKMLETGIKFRDTVIKNVEKFLNCGKTGYATFVCENCGVFHHINFRCKLRFCPTCGNRYNYDRAEVIAHKIVDCHHRHCVFTISDLLRNYFRKDWKLMDVLFAAVHDTICNQFKSNQTPAFICVLHTFGRDLKWNPQSMFCLLKVVPSAQIGLKKDILTMKVYENLSKLFCSKKMYTILGRSFKPIIGEFYRNARNGFYVNAPKTNEKIRNLIKYIGRYLGRPVIANSRIDDYDGKNVTFHYQRHEDNRLITEKIPATEFIKRLVIHIPLRYFNMVRFYGLYAQSSKKFEKIVKIIKQKRVRLRFRELLLKTLGVDPHKCAKCGSTLAFCWLTYTPYNEIRLSGNSPPISVFVPQCV